MRHGCAALALYVLWRLMCWAFGRGVSGPAAWLVVGGVQLAASPQEWENRPITCVRGAGVVPLTIPCPPCTRGRQETGPAHVHMFDIGVSGTNRRRAARAARNTTALLVGVILACPGIGLQLALCPVAGSCTHLWCLYPPTCSVARRRAPRP